MSFVENTRRGMAEWLSFTLAPLSFPTYRAIWSASIATNLGGMIQAVGASWLMVSLDPSPTTVALVQTANAGPLMCFSLLAGALADTVDRRILMVTALSFCSLASAGLALMSAFGTMTPGLLLAFTFLIASGAAFYAPPWQASVIDQVPPGKLPQAIALNSLSFNAARSVGPAIGAQIVALLGVTAAFAINAFAYIGMISVLFNWRQPKRTTGPQSLFTAMGDGLRFVLLSPTIMSIMLRGALFCLGASAPMALFPVLAHQLDGDPRTLGALLGFFGAGAMVGALSAPQIRARLTSEGAITAAAIAFGIGTICIGLSRHVFLSAAPIMIAGASWTLGLSTLNIAVQQSSPRWVSGRAISIYIMVAWAGMAAGAATWGMVARALSVFNAFIASGAALLVIAALGKFLRIPEIRVEDLEARPNDIAEPAEEMDPRAGPVVINIEYHVAEANASAFLIAAHALGRVRRRDGARDWSLMQDIDDPTLWIERYHSPTWRDYVHRLSRPIAGDEQIRARVRQLLERPAVLKRRLERPAGSRPLGAPRIVETLPELRV